MEEEKTEIMTEHKTISSNALSFMDGVLEEIKSRKIQGKIIAAPLCVKSLIIEGNSYFVPQQHRNEVRLTLDIPIDVIVLAHEQMTLFVFRNLLNNATNSCPPGGNINVSATRTNEYVTVADNGPGMTSKQLSGLFQVDTNSSHSGGAGLALSISYDMI